MPILICAATAGELASLAPGHFPAPDSIPEMRLIPAQSGRGEVIYLVTGVGPINAALAIGFCLGQIRDRNLVTGIIYAGLAGTFDLELAPLCSIWQIDREIWPEYGLNDGISVTARAFRHALWERSDNPVYEEIELSDLTSLPLRLTKQPDWQRCASLTVAGVTASFQRREALWNRWHIPLENMEGFAAAYAALRGEIPFVEIRVVSNKTGPRRADEKDFDGALKKMGEILPCLGLI